MREAHLEICKLVLLCLVGTCLGACQSDEAEPIPPIPQQPAYRQVIDDGAWCWFADPRAMRPRGSDSTFVGFIDSHGDIQVAELDGSAELLQATTLRRLEPDDHDSPALLEQEDGRLVAFYSQHSGAMFFRTTREPRDISDWTDEQQIKANVEGTHGYTYPNPILLRDEGRLFLFFRGASWKPTFTTTTDMQTWSEAQLLIEGAEERPYLKFASDGRSRIHIAFTDGHPRKTPHNNIYYVYYEDGGFYRADGTFLRKLEDLPLQFDEVEKAYDAAESPRAWIWDVVGRADKTPVLVYATLPPDQGNHSYHYAHWDGERWNRTLLTDAGPSIAPGTAEPHYSGGVVIDHEDPNRLYLSRQIDGTHEVEQWDTDDGGETWAVTEITSESAVKNMRPVAVRNHGGTGVQMFWMRGKYEHYFEKYQTQLIAYLGPSLPSNDEN